MNSSEIHMSPDDCNKLFWLIANDVVFLSPDKDPLEWTAAVLCNDFFCYGADAEDFDSEDISEIAALYQEFGYDGVYAWVSKQRGWENPVKNPCKSKEFKAAIAKLQSED